MKKDKSHESVKRRPYMKIYFGGVVWDREKNTWKMEWADNAGLDNVKWLTRDSNATFILPYLLPKKTKNNMQNTNCQRTQECNKKNRPSTIYHLTNFYHFSSCYFALNLYTTFFANFLTRWRTIYWNRHNFLLLFLLLYAVYACAKIML